MKTKKCKGCGYNYETTTTYFYFDSKGYPKSKCKSCISKDMKKQYRSKLSITPEEKKEREHKKRLKSFREGGTIKSMALRAGCSRPTFRRWMEENKLERTPCFVQRKAYKCDRNINVDLLMSTIVTKNIRSKDTITKIIYQIHSENRKVMLT